MTTASRSLRIIGVGSSLGAPSEGTARGPAGLLEWGLAWRLGKLGRDIAGEETIVIPACPAGADMAQRLALIGEQGRRLAERVAAALAAGEFPLVLGGDHAIAAGTWRGAASQVEDGAMGLLWIDAHLDSHTQHSSHTGNIHGMPLAALLGEGSAELAEIPGPRLDPRRVCIVGARSWEPEEHERLARLGVRVFAMPEIDRRGLPAVMAEALNIVRRGTAGFGVSLDLDAVDAVALPGVTCPVPDGLAPQALADCLHALRGCPDLIALEIVEYVPERDPDRHTAAWVCRFATAVLGPASEALRAKEQRYGAHNYAPLPLVITRGDGAWLWDVAGRRYLDMLSAYSAVSFGHAHPRLVRALTEQAQRLALTSRACYNDRLPLLLERLGETFGYDAALPTNTGLEAVETALKAARKWAYKVKGVAPERAEIIACEGNFHGRSIAGVAMSSEAQYRDGFGPFPPGFRRIPYGDAAALDSAIGPDTAAFLVEPIQGEGGIVVPPAGWLARCAEICRRHGVLLIADEIQTGLGRTGKLLACEHEGVRPDAVILGKALGGGLLPVSAFLADRYVMDVFRPGDHGSTFGGNPLAAAVALEALDLLCEEGLAERAARLGERLLARLRRVGATGVREVRGRGLLIGIDLDPTVVPAPRIAEQLLARGLMTRDTHGTVLRLAPPLIIEEATLDWAADVVADTLMAIRPPMICTVIE